MWYQPAKHTNTEKGLKRLMQKDCERNGNLELGIYDNPFRRNLSVLTVKVNIFQNVKFRKICLNKNINKKNKIDNNINSNNTNTNLNANNIVQSLSSKSFNEILHEVFNKVIEYSQSKNYLEYLYKR